MTREELLSRARRELWAGWVLSSEEIGSQAAETLLAVGMLVEPGGAAELDRLRDESAKRAALLTDVQAIARRRIAEAKGREAYGKRLEAENAALRKRVAELEAAQVPDGIDRLIAPTQALRAEGEHYAATHHTYLLGRDLPSEETTR